MAQAIAAIIMEPLQHAADEQMAAAQNEHLTATWTANIGQPTYAHTPLTCNAQPKQGAKQILTGTAEAAACLAVEEAARSRSATTPADSQTGTQGQLDGVGWDHLGHLCSP